jgi:hypothetical protein
MLRITRAITPTKIKKTITVPISFTSPKPETTAARNNPAINFL